LLIVFVVGEAREGCVDAFWVCSEAHDPLGSV
jgi:hypothetical protein